MREKMTDEQIIKALECCGSVPFCTEDDDCPYKDVDDCIKKNTQDAIDLIRRQQDEIASLREQLDAAIAGQETLQRYILRLKERAGDKP